MERIFVTGATGYVGRRFVAAAAASGVRVTALVRSPERVPEEVRGAPGVELAAGDLLDASAYRAALARCGRVVHLAASTGKVSRADHFRTNVEGTRALAETARAAGVRGFLHVSTISAAFADLRRYWYGLAKAEAETLVRAAGMPFTVVRPTMILGPASPMVAGLAGLARMLVVPVFGPGTARVQPVWIDDVVACLLAITTTDRFRGETLDLGGPDVVTIEDLLRRIRAASGAGAARVVHIPAGPTRAALGLVEPLLRSVLPVTAGQICPFVNDGVAAPLPDDFAPRPTVGVDDALARSFGRG